MSFLRRQKVRETPAPVDPADATNRIDQARRRRLATGGRASTWLASAAAEAATPSQAATVGGGA